MLTEVSTFRRFLSRTEKAERRTISKQGSVMAIASLLAGYKESLGCFKRSAAQAVYETIAQWGGAGASVPLTGFGSNLAKGVAKAVEEKGWLGIFTGPLTAAAGGVAAAVAFGLLAALLFKPGEKR